MKYSVLFSFILHGCAQGVYPENLENFPPHPCDPTALSSDFWNCGACDAVCPLDDTDTCTASTCLCGNDLPCLPGSDCAYGGCLFMDPTGAVCEFKEECGTDYLCIEGRCTFFEATPEICDAQDNNQDGIIDGTLQGPLTQWCLGEGITPVEDILPPCNPGFRICTRGLWSECMGDIPPVPEQGTFLCDGVDNDCNSCIDSELLPDGTCSSQLVPRAYDVIFALDISGSMVGKINNVLAAVQSFAGTVSNNPLFSFGIVVISRVGVVDGEPELYLDLSDYPTFVNGLATLDLTGGGREPQYDTVYMLATGEMPISWHVGSTRIIVIFSDEEGQTTVLRNLTQEDMCASLVSGEALYFFINEHFRADFDLCDTAIFSLGTSEEMQRELEEQVLINPC